MITYHAQFYRLGDRRLLGLVRGNLHVAPTARMQGFFLLRRYMNNPKADFCFATSCNVNSAPLWVKCGAGQAPNSDIEYLYVNPDRTGPQEVALRKGLPNAWRRRFARRPPRIALLGSAPPPTRADGTSVRRLGTARRNRGAEPRPAQLTHDRTADILRDKYEALSKQGAASDSTDGIYLFTAEDGREGWFSLRQGRRGPSARS